MQQRPQLFQRMAHWIGRTVGIGPPFRARLDEMLQQRAQVVLADVGQESLARAAAPLPPATATASALDPAP